MNVFEHNFITLQGASLPLNRFQGQPILIVNTATRSRYATQFSQMEKIWQDYHNSGLVVLAVPTNDFADREPGDDDVIESFLDHQYRVNFPISRKEHVCGRGAHPLYRHLAEEMGNDYLPQWNFFKTLFDTRGEFVNIWPSAVDPTDQAITHAIELNLHSWVL